MKYFSDVAAFVLVVVFLVFAVIFTPINSDNNIITGFVTHPIYTGYAVPISSINVDTTLVFNNATDVANRLFEVTDDIIYRRAYISYDGQSWTQFNMTPVSTASGEWIYGRSAVSLSFTPKKFNLNSTRTFSNNTYLIIYSCSKNTTIHNWSCHDGWQIIKFDARLNTQPICTIHNRSACDNGDVYWYDSCNVREEIQIDCNATQMCSNGVCINPSNSSLKYLVRNGVGSADIIISESAPSSVKIAADELQTYIQKMSGALLPIRNTVDSSKNYHIYVGQSSYTNNLGITTSDCKHDGFKIVSRENYLVLIGYDTPFHYVFPGSYPEWDALNGHYWENPATIYNRRYSRTFDLWEGDGKGSLNAVYQFLQDQGVRWYYPGDIGEIVPSKKDIGFSDMNIIKNPDFELRQWFQYNTEYKDEQNEEIKWQLRMRLTTDDVDVGAALFHGLYSITMRDEQQALHPEYFDQGDCASCVNQVDLCSAGVFQEDLEYIRFMFDTYDVPMVSVMPTDGLTYAAAECEEKNTFGRTEYGEAYDRNGWISDYVFEYVNNIAWQIYEEYPDKKISCAAYATYTLPPEKIAQLAPNVVVFLDRRGTHRTASPQSEKTFYTAITNDWIEKIPSKRVYTGSFFIYHEHNCPVIYPHMLSDEFKFLQGKSKGDFMEISREDNIFNGYALDAYVTAQLYWDNDLDIDSLLNEYYTLYYGPAASQMKAFVEYSENNYWKCNSDPSILANLKQMADDARATAGNTIYGERIDMLIAFMNA